VVVRLVAAALAGLALGTLATFAIAPFSLAFRIIASTPGRRSHEGCRSFGGVSGSPGHVGSPDRVVYPLVRPRPKILFRLARSLLPGFCSSPFHFSCTERNGNEPPALRKRKDDASHRNRHSRGHCCASGHRICSCQVGTHSKGGAGSAAAKSNFLLITFDALNAEDVSLYGYRLPTTPNIDAFARKALSHGKSTT